MLNLRNTDNHSKINVVDIEFSFISVRIAIYDKKCEYKSILDVVQTFDFYNEHFEWKYVLNCGFRTAHNIDNLTFGLLYYHYLSY